MGITYSALYSSCFGGSSIGHSFQETQFVAEMLKDPQSVFVDLREHDLFLQEHLRTALNFPAEHAKEMIAGKSEDTLCYDTMRSWVRLKDRIGYTSRDPFRVFLYTQNSAYYDQHLISIIEKCRYLFHGCIIMVIDEGMEGLSSTSLLVDTTVYREEKQEESGNEDFQSLVSEVEEGFLYVGQNLNVYDKRLVAAFGITHLINVGSEAVEEHERKQISEECGGRVIEYSSIPFRTSTQDEFVDQILALVLLLNRLFSESRRVLLFSSKNDINFTTVSDPAAAVSLAFLMQHHGWTLREAFDHLMEMRPWTRPSPELVAALLYIEHDMQSDNPVGKYNKVILPRSLPSVPLKCYIAHFAEYEDLCFSVPWMDLDLPSSSSSSSSSVLDPDPIFEDLDETQTL